jgi:hypothetical protein
MKTPYGYVDMNLFFVSTTITAGNGRSSLFEILLGLMEGSPMTLPPLIYEASTRKMRSQPSLAQ